MNNEQKNFMIFIPFLDLQTSSIENLYARKGEGDHASFNEVLCYYVTVIYMDGNLVIGKKKFEFLL